MKHGRQITNERAVFTSLNRTILGCRRDLWLMISLITFSSICSSKNYSKTKSGIPNRTITSAIAKGTGVESDIETRQKTRTDHNSNSV